MYEAEDIIEKLFTDGNEFSYEEFTTKFVGIESKDVIAYFDEIIERLRSTGKIGNAEVYKNVRNSISSFTKGKRINFHSINTRFLNKYVEKLQINGNKGNTINLYLRTLRALFNKSIDEGLCSRDKYPFRNFKFNNYCLLYTSPSPRDRTRSRMPSSA